jgi:flagellar biogenesis protein FliO
MRSIVCIVVLILVTTYPAGLVAQVAPAVDQQESSAGAVSASPVLKRHTPADHPEAGKKLSGLSSTSTVVGSLSLVLGIFFLVVWALRRASSGGLGTLPAEVLEVLGRAPLANRQQAMMLRCGNKLLLVAMGAAGMETLTEITDSAEVDRLMRLCRQGRSNGAAAALRQVFGHKEGRDE